MSHVHAAHGPAHDHAHDHAHPPGLARAAAHPLNRIAAVATLHCLLGCAIGEVAGLALGTALGWGNAATVALAVALAFVSGFALTAWPLRRRGLPLATALRVALAADAASITLMEVVDNALMLAIPGAMDAPVNSALFWLSMGLSLALAGLAAFPLNRWLIGRGQGHALAHGHHGHHRH